jgi:hypothetical protein
VYNVNITSSDTSVLSTDGAVLSAISNGSAEINVTAKHLGKSYETSGEITVGNVDYDISSARKATGITIARKTDVLEIGEEFALQAYVLSEMTDDHPWSYCYTDENLVKYSSDNPSVCRVKNGVLFGVATGKANIEVSDLGGNVSKSFSVEVVEETSLHYTENEVWTIGIDDYDWSDAETTTLAFIEIVAKAKEDGMKKVVFPNQTFYISPAYGTINVPTETILDFSGSTIQIENSALTASGYNMFLFQNTEHSSIENAVIYGERYLISGTGAESCQSVYFAGYNYKSGLKNCTISNSPGFNIGAMLKNLVRIPFKLTAVEAGGIDNLGADKEEAYAFRNKGYMNISTVGKRFGFGNMQGYQGYLYLSARVYSIFFYDANYKFLSSLENCVQYYLYDKPEGAVYARIVFWQASAPTSCDGDFGAIAMIYSMDAPNRCYIRDCVMENNYSTAIQPNGGESWVIENCTFRDNGIRDPSSHIDWEDGRNNNKGHVLRNCTFERGGYLMVIGADGLVMHNNILKNMTFKQGGEVQNSRIWLNQFANANAIVESKTDMVFSQNFAIGNSTFTLTDNTATSFAIRKAGNSE